MYFRLTTRRLFDAPARLRGPHAARCCGRAFPADSTARPAKRRRPIRPFFLTPGKADIGFKWNR